jgi:sphingosine kinase
VLSAGFLNIHNATVTERVGHGKEIAKALDIDDYDGLVVFSGDGLIFEAVNGLASRSDGLRALSQCPIGVIPGGR